MIKFNKKTIEVSHFPDGTQYIKFPENPFLNYIDEIMWLYDSDEELFTLACVVNWYNRVIKNPVKDKKFLRLVMPYVPNARMDRIKNTNENFSLKVFANFINSLGFDEVCVMNVHSNVSEALIDNINVRSYTIDWHIETVIKKEKPDVIFFPDEGACKRYADLASVKESDLPVIFGIKKRDWKSGDIKGLDIITDIDIKDKKILIIDDICSKGGTFMHSAIKLKNMGASDVILYVSHCEDNIKNGVLLGTDLISKIYTTDSILHIEDPKIQIIENFRK